MIVADCNVEKIGRGLRPWWQGLQGQVLSEVYS